MTNSISICLPFHDYNLHMGGIDSNAQVRVTNQCDITCFRWWWSLLTQLFIAGAVWNSWYLFHKTHPTTKLTHRSFQHAMAMALIRNPLAISRKRSKAQNNREVIDEGQTRCGMVKTYRKAYCQSCMRDIGDGRATRVPRRPFSELVNNVKERRRRAPRVIWGCRHCEGSACCNNERCFQRLRHKFPGHLRGQQ